MDLSSVVLAPIRVPQRIVQALDDLATLAERARRDPDPVEEARERIDALIAELRIAVAEIRRLIAGGAELTETAKSMHVTMTELVAGGERLERDTRELIAGGRELTETSKTLHVDTRELIDGGSDLTAVSETLERHMRVFRAALPRLLEGLDTVEDLEEAVETVADTVEPLQQTAERVGRVTRRLSRSAS